MNPIIDHDPKEPNKGTTPWLWPAVVVMLLLLWSGYLVTQTPDWLAVGLGFGTGAVLVAWAIEATGNKFFSPTDERSPD